MNISVKFVNKKIKPNHYILFLEENGSVIFDKSKSFDLDPKTINKFISNNDKKQNKFINFNINDFQKVTIAKLSKNITLLEIEKLGAQFFEILKKNYIFETCILENNIINNFKFPQKLFDHFLFGLKVKSYEFNKYKSDNKIKNLSINLIRNKKSIIKQNIKFESLIKGIDLTKDLVSEPGNVLNPDQYVKELLKLKKFGLKITILNKTKLKKLGMNALLGVGQGSAKGSYLVMIEWNGTNKKIKPLAFVGKGVCFDTGGISLKPAKFMEDMTYDMAGSAVVAGLLKTLALRKAKVNAVGVVGLVENMPDGNAQRPGDIVRSYSGKTIEILNTDAEGRLVLADALTYTEKKYKPKFIVDLATLTGAIIVSLGSEYAGLFSNDDKISDQLTKAGEKINEKVWRMPLNDNYDKLINSKKADMQNINYVGGAGSTTAAQFLQRFILKKTPWAHLDIAGMAFSKYGGALNSGGATGYGVRLLNQLIEENYE